MTPTKHATLSPSSSERWLICTPSALLESIEPQVNSKYAAQGTEAHALAEIKLSHALGKMSDEQFKTEFDAFVLGSSFYDEEFNDYVDDYVNEVMLIVNEDYKGQEIEVFLEQSVEFNDIVPDGQGTSDVVIVGKTFVHVIDLKFGKGIAVSALGNTQLRLYALGAIKGNIRKCNCQEAIMTIIQPRLHDITTDRMSITELNDWAINVVKPAADLAIVGKGELISGDHCKFCKRRGKCETLGERQLQIAQAQFEEVVVDDNILEPKNMTPEMIAKVLFIAPKFIDWFKSVKNHALNTMINDEVKIPGYKLVEGRSTRVITNPEGLEEKLRISGYAEKDYLKPKTLLGITALEKNIGKKLFVQLSEEYVIKPSGSPTMALEADKRVALDAKSLRLDGTEFDDEIETGE